MSLLDQAQEIRDARRRAKVVVGFDTRQTIRIFTSPWRLLISAVVVTGFCVFLLVASWTSTKHHPGLDILTLVACALLPFILWRSIRQGSRLDEPVLILSPEGFLARNLSRQTIPWVEVEGVRRRELSPRSLWGNPVVEITLSDHALETIEFSKWNGRILTASRSLGLKSIIFSHSSLGMRFDELYRLFVLYTHDHGGRAL